MPEATKEFDPDVVLLNVSGANLDLVLSGVRKCFRVSPSQVYRPDWMSTGIALSERVVARELYRPLIVIEAGEAAVQRSVDDCVRYLVDVFCSGIIESDYLIVILVEGQDTRVQRRLKGTHLRFEILNLANDKSDIETFASQLALLWKQFRSPSPAPGLFTRIFGS